MREDLIKNTPKLGFGFMRLPHLPDGSFDMEQVKKMVDIFMERGFTYFDTAYVYTGCEAAIKEALVDRYPRESFTIATKLCAFMECKDEASAKQQFYTSLERTGAGYFDYYMLHSLEEDNYFLYDDYGLWDFVKERRDEGLIKNWGFSFHSDAKRLDELLTLHPDVDFVQLQINYADWESPTIQSGACYEVARKHGVPVIIMEPVKGGLLAKPPARVQEMFSSYDPNSSFASWAIRFTASLEGILTILSGMSSIEQVEDNTTFMQNIIPLNDDEQEIIKKARGIIAGQKTIPCTSCGYCKGGCPMNIDIPTIFTIQNQYIQYENEEHSKRRYRARTANGGKASDCIRCMQCENACPQQLPVVSLLEDAAYALED